MLALQELGEKFDASTFDWTGVKDHGLHNRCIRGQLEKKSVVVEFWNMPKTS